MTQTHAPEARDSQPVRAVTPPSMSKRMRGVARRMGLRRTLKVAARALGFDLVKRHFYSPVPDFAGLSDGFWERRSSLTGVRFEPDAQLRFVEERLAPYVAEFTPPLHYDPSRRGFYLDNGTYGPVDAELLYAIVRSYRAQPGRRDRVGLLEPRDRRGAGGERARRRARRTTRSSTPGRGRRPTTWAAPTPCAAYAHLRQTSITEVPPRVLRGPAGRRHPVRRRHPHCQGRRRREPDRARRGATPRARACIVHFHDVFLPLGVPARVGRAQGVVLGRAVPAAGLSRLQRLLRDPDRGPTSSPATTTTAWRRASRARPAPSRSPSG